MYILIWKILTVSREPSLINDTEVGSTSKNTVVIKKVLLQVPTVMSIFSSNTHSFCRDGGRKSEKTH